MTMYRNFDVIKELISNKIIYLAVLFMYNSDYIYLCIGQIVIYY